MTAPRLKVGGIVRDDAYDGVARLRVDLSGNLWLDAEDLSAMALMLATPPAVNHAAIMRQVRDEADVRRREEHAASERERIAAGDARAADVARLREQFPTLADQMFPPTDDSPAWRVFTVQGSERTYLERYGFNGGPLHTTDRQRAMRFGNREAAAQQARTFVPPYMVEEATT